jgi:choline dehydrogenase-like flavoprotein
MADASRHFDVIIVGSGAGGATIAHALAPTGKKILILERGEHLPRSRDNWDPRRVFVDRSYRTKDVWRDKNGKPFHPNTHYWVGGNTTFYGGALFRLRPGDFDRQIHHGGGVSPAWPISYTDLAPYYLEAERLWKVRGLRGADPTEPRGVPDYFHPPLTHDPTIANLEKHFQKLGWRPFPLPIGVDRDDSDPVSSNCIRCVTCGGYPCLVRAKSDARTIALDPILRMPNVTLAHNQKVTKLETDHTGKTIRHVMAMLPDGSWIDYSADIVVLAAGAVNTAVILLNSANTRHQNGLANGSDQVGRNYMFHTLSAVVSATPAKVEADFPKTLAVNDFYWRDPDGTFEHPMGHIQLLEHMEGHVLEGQIEEEGINHRFIPDFVADAAAERLLAFLVISEDLPEAHNRVRLQDGHIRLEYTHGDIVGHKRLTKKLDWALDRFDDGGHIFTRHHFQFTKMLPLYGTAHMCGTTRMGVDAKSSVIDPNCKAWELDNLYIADASVFPSSSAVNPTLTIVANAMRVANIIKERLGARVELPPPTPEPGAPEITPAEARAIAQQRKRRSIWPFGR